MGGMQSQSGFLPSDEIGDEYCSAWFGDERLTTRLVQTALSLAADPTASFPSAFSCDAALEGAYRFLNNRRVNADEILQGHYEATAARANGQKHVLLLHDTTEMRFGGSSTREGLGTLSGTGQGFLAHATLAVSADGERRPLGSLAWSTWVRTPRKCDAPVWGNAGRRGEFRRWEEQALLAESRLDPATKPVHVMDREADAYALLAALSLSRFIVRAQHDRQVLSAIGESKSLRDAATEAPTIFERDVPLSRRQTPRRKPTVTRKMHPPREARLARLAIRATPVILRRDRRMPRDLPTELVLNVVQVAEVDAPPHQTPVEWLLVTNLTTDTAEQLAAIVDSYRTRWLIEEFFKALKSGCRVEQRQLESLHALENAAAIFVPIAWHMLALRAAERSAPDQPAAALLSPMQIGVLRATTSISHSPSVSEALSVIARLGGHLRHNGAPGWQTLATGFIKLFWLEIGWAARGGKM